MKNIFNTILFKFTIFLFLAGLSFLILENSFYQQVDENNVLQESYFMPLAITTLSISIICFIFLLIKLYIHCYEKTKSLKENVTGINFDFSEDILSVYFEISDKKFAEDVLSEVDFIKNIKELKNGFILDITAQHIPEVIASLRAVNIAIYAVIPQKNNL